MKKIKNIIRNDEDIWLNFVFVAVTINVSFNRQMAT
jgi:hypothetical protein